jgi:hypothetical protein
MLCGVSIIDTISDNLISKIIQKCELFTHYQEEKTLIRLTSYSKTLLNKTTLDYFRLVFSVKEQ